ncbi:MAG: DUF2341 domain-containing protein [Kiritimatiellia bacterium]|jgi:hypothetical protein
MKHLNTSRIVVALVAAISLTFVPADAGALESSDFTHRMSVTFSGYAGSTTLDDFPALVKLSTEIAGFTYDSFMPDGTDLRFADADGNELDYEIDNWNTNGVSTIWVRVPSFDATSQIWAYWGGTFTDHADSVTNGAVWAPSAHVGVWHFNDLVNGVAFDSTTNKLDATANAPDVSAVRTDGMIGNCVLNSNSSTAADGTGFLTRNYNDLAVGSTFTISGWFRHRQVVSAGTFERVITRKESSSGTEGFHTELNPDFNELSASGRTKTSTVKGKTPNLGLGQWCHIVFGFNGSTAQIFTNGAASASGSIDPATDNGLPLAFGNDSDANTHTFKGSFDEFRFRDAVSTPDWIQAEHDAVVNVGFASFGPIEPAQVDIPLLAPSSVNSVDFHSASFSYTLMRLGSSNPDVTIVYGTVPGVYTHTNLVAAGVAETGAFSYTLSGLACVTTYYAKFIAANASGTMEDGELTFTTPGEPLMGPATMAASGTTLSISGSITNIGIASATVELWFGTDTNALVKIDEWPSLSAPQTFSKTRLNQPFNTYYCAFRAYNVYGGVTNETWTAAAAATIFGDVTWMGTAGDNSWNNPQNWNPMSVPAFMDTAVFTDSGIGTDTVIALNADQHVRKIIIETAKAFSIGHTNDIDAGYSLTVTDLDRRDVEGEEGMHDFRAPVNLAPDATGNVTWTINGDSRVRMNAVLDSVADATFVKMGDGTFSMYFRSPRYTGPWNIVEGTMDISYSSYIANYLDGTARGAFTIGGTEVPAALNIANNGIYKNSTVVVLTNGTFTQQTSN